MIIATSYEVFEAEYLKNQLETKGFEVYLADDKLIGMNNFLAPALGGIKIKVPNDQSLEAAQFIDDLRHAEIIYDENFPEN